MLFAHINSSLNPLVYAFSNNSSLNPLVYAFSNPLFQKGYKNIFNKMTIFSKA